MKLLWFLLLSCGVSAAAQVPEHGMSARPQLNVWVGQQISASTDSMAFQFQNLLAAASTSGYSQQETSVFINVNQQHFVYRVKMQGPEDGAVLRAIGKYALRSGNNTLDSLQLLSVTMNCEGSCR